ncbi:hypothetical protein CHS0354_016199 [Potamilus streckersoni]|uniref:Uncharacterized protein n=1 Tax=Potamilus streckersoni TaxID=2493646 RepID=A0AAE0VKW0_9BIVA|nr:hypothetical protein CHS0354_016199 [Potamilus streckersoni]
MNNGLLCTYVCKNIEKTEHSESNSFLVLRQTFFFHTENKVGVGMPQVISLKALENVAFRPIGPGSLFNKSLQVSDQTRKRAQHANNIEKRRLDKLMSTLQREQRFMDNIQARVIQQTSQSFTERHALQEVLSSDYRVDNFITMKKKLKPEDIHDRKTMRRFIIESRVFNSGFGMHALYPEVKRKIKQSDISWEVGRRKKLLLRKNQEVSKTVMNPTMSQSAFRRMLSDRKHWTQYNTPRQNNNDVALSSSLCRPIVFRM